MFRKRFIIVTMLILFIPPAAAAGSPAGKPAADAFGYPITTVSVTDLRGMLEKGQYKQLNAFLQTCQDQMVKDIRQEYKVYDAYEALALADAAQEAKLSRWVTATPKNYQPYLARANYYHNMAWESRGSAWAADTSAKQFSGMESYFALEQADLGIVLKLYPRAFLAYDLQIGMYMALSQDKQRDAAAQTCLKLYPYSFLIRADYIHSLKPRWGGNYAKMAKVEAQAYVKANPRLALLEGYVAADRANLAKNNNRHDTAVTLYKQALALGDFWLWYYELATAYYKMGRDQEAMASVNRALALRPLASRAFVLRALLQYKLGKYIPALQDIEAARSVASLKSDYQDDANWLANQALLKGYKLYEAKDFDGALVFYDLSASFDPEYGELFYWRGRLYAENNEFGKARADLEAALRLEPADFDACLLYDWLMAKESKWDLIIAAWSRLLELDPKNARAYYERGGAYYHKGDLQAALKDAKRAADLGDKDAQQMHERLSGQNR